MSNLQSTLADFFANATSPVLFVGAGVSARAGLPVWSKYLSDVAELIKQFDPLVYQIIMTQINANEFLNAATYYFVCKNIPEARKYKILAEPLKKYDHRKVLSLAKLPVQAYVTTNFDKVLHDVYATAKGKSALEINYGDVGFKAAPFENDFYIARIHGRAEVPETMRLSEAHYAEILTDQAYIGYLSHIFTRKQILFIGFSFFDPAIQQILKVVNDNVGKVHEGEHLALLPDGIDSEFTRKLERMNIRKVFYDPSNHHQALWEALDTLILDPKVVEPHQLSVQEEPFNIARRYVASCYARAQLGDKIIPLRKTVVEGMVSHLIQSQKTKGIEVKALVSHVQEELRISLPEVEQLVRESLEALKIEKLCNIQEVNGQRRVFWKGDFLDSTYDKAINLLAKGAIDRFVVRENGVDKPEYRKCLEEFFRKLVLVRGWDLGAAFASNKAPDELSIKQVLESTCDSIPREVLKGFNRACEDLIRYPNSEEARLLSDLGRTSFALELVIQAPHDILFHSLTLPQVIYLDANVLLPALTVGHPYHEVYKSSIERLKEAASSALGGIRVVAYYGFLNEVVSHRKIAEQQLKYADKEQLAALRKEAILVTQLNMNVFVGAYANLLIKSPELKFSEFLSRYAPYKNEKELEAWLNKQEIQVLHEHKILNGTEELPNILHSLEKAYADKFTGKPGKTATLIRHDAIQVAGLYSDIKNNRKSVLVSADRQLREKVGQGEYSYLANSIISHVGLAQLIDLLVGNPVKSRSMSSILWTARTSSTTEQVRNYLINLALDEYDEAIAMEMNRVVESIAEDAVQALEDAGIADLNFSSADDAQKAMKVLEGFEDKFFATMKERIEEKRKE